jgi:hypothetical protein
MKKSVLIAGLVWPALAFGQQAYTNADLVKLDVPGAYTNQDLRRLPPLVVQRGTAATLAPRVAPEPVQIAPYQETYDRIRFTRDSFAFERDLEMNRIEFSESAFAGDSRTIEPRLGYRTQAAPLVLELEKRIAILDQQLELLVDRARRDGAFIDQR